MLCMQLTRMLKFFKLPLVEDDTHNVSNQNITILFTIKLVDNINTLGCLISWEKSGI